MRLGSIALTDNTSINALLALFKKEEGCTTDLLLSFENW